MEKFSNTWPVDIHVVGKDILRFHAIFWPSFLMAAELPLPRKILCHGHWLVDNRKMSKSIGNVIDPFECMKKYSRDGMRYFLLREGVPASDCNISVNKFTKYINSDLANTLGNLYQRCLPFNKNMNYPSFENVKDYLTSEDKEFLVKLDQIRIECEEHYEAFNFYNGIQSIMARLRLANNLVQEYKPWDLVKSSDVKDKIILNKMLFFVYESLRISGILLQPIVPDISKNILGKLNIAQNERVYINCQVNYNSNKEAKKLSDDKSTIFKRLID